MTTKEIEKAAKAYVRDSYGSSIPQEHSFNIAINAFKEGVELANKIWQEKTRWKSLETEPPTIFGERVQVILKNKHGELSLAPVYSARSIEDFLYFGFIEWKEIE